jgi:Icc-related predicted phosphoesterase
LNRCDKKRKRVVITHHAPSYNSISPGFENSNLNSAFVSDLDKLMIQYNPVLWVHGHTHSSCNYVIGKTHVISNPCGYYGENKKYNDKLCVEV